MALGWRIYGVESPAAAYKDALKNLVRLGSDKAFRKGVTSMLGGGDKETSGKAGPGKKAAPAPKTDWLKIKSKTVAAMPTGSEVIAIELSQQATQELLRHAKRRGHTAKKVEEQGLSGLLAVVPDGGRTWFVFAMDEKTLVERARGVVSTSKAPRLSTRSDIGFMRGQPAVQAGFWSLLAVKGWLQQVLVARGKSAREADTLLSTTPHHGSTPMPFRVIVTGDDRRHAIEFQTSFPRTAFEDVAAAVPTLMMLSP
jgi:hypothetical protein